MVRPCSSNFELTYDAYCENYWTWISVRIYLENETDYHWNDDSRHGVTTSCSWHVTGADIMTTYFPRYAWTPVKVTLNNNLLSLYINDELRGQANVNYAAMNNICIIGHAWIKNIKLKY